MATTDGRPVHVPTIDCPYFPCESCPGMAPHCALCGLAEGEHGEERQ